MVSPCIREHTVMPFACGMVGCHQCLAHTVFVNNCSQLHTHYPVPLEDTHPSAITNCTISLQTYWKRYVPMSLWNHSCNLSQKKCCPWEQAFVGQQWGGFAQHWVLPCWDQQSCACEVLVRRGHHLCPATTPWTWWSVKAVLDTDIACYL